MSALPSPIRQRRKEARPQALMDAALELFTEKGFTATRSEEIAARAGVSKGTLYLYFPSKEELLKAVIRERLSNRIGASAERVGQHQGAASDLLVDLLGVWWAEVFSSPAAGVFKVILVEARNFPEIGEFYHREVVQPGQQVIGRILQMGIDQGEFRPLDVPAAVQSLIFPMVMLCLHKYSHSACMPEPDVDPLRFIRSHIELMLNGMRRTPGLAGQSAVTGS